MKGPIFTRLQKHRGDQGQRARGDGETIWLHQKHDGLGHMIAITPAISALHEMTGEPVPVWFDGKKLAKLYADDPQIAQMKRPPSYKPLFNSANYDSHAKHVAEHYLGLVREATGYDGTYPRPYVPSCNEPDGLPPSPRVAIVHGSRWLAAYASKKTLPVEARISMLMDPPSLGFSTVLIGVKRDVDQFWSKLEAVHPVGMCRFIERDLRQAVGALQACDAVIANDTGMAHVAGASGIPTLVLGPNMPDHWMIEYGAQHRYSTAKGFCEQRREIVRFLEVIRESVAR